MDDTLWYGQGFKLRDGMVVGCKVTLRGERMYEFLDRLINVALPRVRDFRGISGKSFDGRGNFSLGIKEQIIFPEINYDRVDQIRGMDVVICTTADSDDEARELLREFNMNPVDFLIIFLALCLITNTAVVTYIQN